MPVTREYWLVPASRGAAALLFWASTLALLGSVGCTAGRYVIGERDIDAGADAEVESDDEDGDGLRSGRASTGSAARRAADAGSSDPSPKAAGASGSDPGNAAAGSAGPRGGSAGSASPSPAPNTAGSPSPSNASPSPSASNSAGTAAPSMTAAAGSPAPSGSAAPGPTPAAFDCTRAGLASLVSAYFEAMAAHDTTRVPFAPHVKLTENAKPVALGEGLWKTAGALKFKRSALDPESCATFTEAAIEGTGLAMIVGVRLKLDAARITEVETYIADPAGGMPQGLIASAKNDWEAQLLADQRRTREQLTAVADAYFDSLGDPLKPAPYDTPCEQSMNGLSTAQIAANAGVSVASTCGSVLLPVIPGLPNINASPTHRRYPVIDTDAGIVIALGLVAQNYLNASMLKVVAGKIRFIDSVNGPAVVSPGWD